MSISEATADRPSSKSTSEVGRRHLSHDVRRRGKVFGWGRGRTGSYSFFKKFQKFLGAPLDTRNSAGTTE